MAHILPFQSLRPIDNQKAKNVATKPYDTVSYEEVLAETTKNPLSFLNVTRSEASVKMEKNPYDEKVYKAAYKNLHQLIKDGILMQDQKACYYIYALTRHNKTQTGLVCISSIADYENNIIKKHELTRVDKELDRINHIKNTNAQTGNVFLAYKDNNKIKNILSQWKQNNNAIYNFYTQDDETQHDIWCVDNDTTIQQITDIFNKEIAYTYIADGHHRAASASKTQGFFNTTIQSNKYFLTTLFAATELTILEYNRLIKTNPYKDAGTFLGLLQQEFIVKPQKSTPQLSPREFGLYIDKQWYLIETNEKLQQHLKHTKDNIKTLDVSILQNHILNPLLNIVDPRTDSNIHFVGGIKGYKALEQAVNSDEYAMAFLLYPVIIQQLFDVADNDQIMPPKSTWFEPKLRDGLFTHLLMP